MPVYNCERYLDAAIRSIRDQTFTDFEFVIVNDGSKDASLDIIRRHAAEDSRIVVLDQPNGGIVSALNAGLAVCQGQYIARMDGDDVSAPNRLHKQLDYMLVNPDVVLLGARVQLICPYGIPLNYKEMFKDYGFETDHNKIDWRLLRGFGGAVVHPVSMMRRSAIDAVGGYRAEYCKVEDLDLFLRLALVGRVTNLPDCLLDYRQHMGSTNHMKQAEQKRLAMSVIREASLARGLPPPPEDLMNWTTPNHVTTLHDWTQNALRTARIDAAWRHAAAALRVKPISRNGWRNLASCMLCTLRLNRGPRGIG